MHCIKASPRTVQIVHLTTVACSGGVPARPRCMQADLVLFLPTNEYHTCCRLQNASASRIVPASATSSDARSKSKLYASANQNAMSYINGIFARYEDFVGLREVREAQLHVREAEKKFSDVQSARREHQTKLRQIQHGLTAIHAELDKTSRGEDRYLTLLTQEHAKIKEEKAILTILDEVESAERFQFSLLSNAVRDSHERERARAEKTKYWSIIGSVAGAIIGIVGTSLNNWLKMRELRGLIVAASADSPSLIGNTNSIENGSKAAPGTVASVHRLLAELVERSRRQQTQMDQLLANERGQIVSSSAESISREHAEVVRVEVAEAIRNAQQNLEWRLKVNSIVSAAFLYTAVVLTLPVVLYFFGGMGGAAAASAAGATPKSPC